MGDKPNPTTPGTHNHLGAKIKPNPFIEGCLIEDGHGSNPVAWQLAEHVQRVFVSAGRAEATALLKRLIASNDTRIDHKAFEAELVARGFMSPDSAAHTRALDEFVPSGRTN